MDKIFPFVGKARYYYHWTWKNNLPGILRDGLVPRIGKCYRDHYEEFNLRWPRKTREIYPCVFLSPTPRIYIGDVLLCVRRDLLDHNALEPDVVMDRRRRCVRYGKAIPAALVEVCGSDCEVANYETGR